MLTFVQRIGVILCEQWRRAKRGKAHTVAPVVEQPCLEILEERTVPAATSGLPVTGPSATLAPGQVAAPTPGTAIPSPVPPRSGNQTSSAGFAQLQNVNDATLFFNN